MRFHQWLAYAPFAQMVILSFCIAHFHMNHNYEMQLIILKSYICNICGWQIVWHSSICSLSLTKQLIQLFKGIKLTPYIHTMRDKHVQSTYPNYQKPFQTYDTIHEEDDRKK